jgi:hypothetical protein
MAATAVMEFFSIFIPLELFRTRQLVAFAVFLKAYTFTSQRRLYKQLDIKRSCGIVDHTTTYQFRMINAVNIPNSVITEVLQRSIDIQTALNPVGFNIFSIQPRL